MPHTRETTQPRYVQDIANLALANRLRAQRAQLKRDLRFGRTTIAQALNRPEVQGMAVHTLLSARFYYGPVRVSQRLNEAGCSQFLRVQALTERQRVALVEACG